ncbi:DUF3526 domain-containing protein [Maribacter antarcticus]|uniref:DUF3526 domain-containing protein n=1 Tax=Maribacter antarcticus TaxID=505250 RepID=UPI000478F4A4|nr:DUF3526 domain-containing protein [Maribacter antarcticus]
MLRYNFKYESILLFRSKWIQVLIGILIMLFGFATYNGQQKTQKRKADIEKVTAEIRTSDQNMLKLLDSVEHGLTVTARPWTIPNTPMAVGNYHPRVASKPPSELSFLATGQSDMFTHFVKPTVRGDDLALNFSEMTSPVQLLFGSFDLAFVIIFLLPLLIIAFSYDVLSSERESGSLRLLAAQPILLYKWLMQKLALRFFWLAAITTATVLLVFLANQVPVSNNFSAILSFLGISLTYVLFWFALAFAVNLWAESSAKNAVALLGLWVVFVLLIPSILNQLGSTLYPIPSRALMVNEMRTIKAEATERQDVILDNYLRNHPEYAVNDTTQERSFWHSYMASQNLIKKELEPVLSKYENQLQKQQQLLDHFTWLSPAILVQRSMNQLADNGSESYEGYRNRVIVFAGEWRDHFLPMLYNNQAFSSEDYGQLPEFTYTPINNQSQSSVLVILLCSGLVVLGVGALRFYVSSDEKHSII